LGVWIGSAGGSGVESGGPSTLGVICGTGPRVTILGAVKL
jgi:hypothetical protein